MRMDPELNIGNRFVVGCVGDELTIMKQLPPRLSKSDALNLAVWLVFLADDNEIFKDLLQALEAA
jgi:hypothetical protein